MPGSRGAAQRIEREDGVRSGAIRMLGQYVCENGQLCGDLRVMRRYMCEEDQWRGVRRRRGSRHTGSMAGGDAE